MVESQHEIEAMIAQCIQGDQSAFQAIYERFATGVFRLCYSLVLTPQDAEDVTQETFIYAFKNVQRFDSHKASFKTWLYTIAVSRCRNTYRRKTFMTVDLSQILQWNMPAPESETPEASLARKTAEDVIVRAITDLSPRLREAVVLRYGHGLTYREMAEIMDCPQKTAESRVRLAHKQLETILHPTGPALLEELLRISS